MRSDQRGKPLITDAEFEVIHPAKPKSWLVRQLERVPLTFWIIAGLALASAAKVGGQP